MSPEQIERLADFGLTLLWCEGPCLVLNKPACLATQAPPGVDSLEARLRRWFGAGDDPDPYLGFIPTAWTERHRGRSSSHCVVKRLAVLPNNSSGADRQNLLGMVEGTVSAPTGVWEDSSARSRTNRVPRSCLRTPPEPATPDWRTDSSPNTRTVAGWKCSFRRPHAPDPHPGLVAGTCHLGRHAVRLDDSIRPARDRPAGWSDRIPCPRTWFSSSADATSGFGGCTAAGQLGRMVREVGALSTPSRSGYLLTQRSKQPGGDCPHSNRRRKVTVPVRTKGTAHTKDADGRPADTLCGPAEM